MSNNKFKTNEYFDGNVISVAFQTATLPATVGVMAVGEYEFGTSQHEKMSVINGAMIVLLPNTSEWQTFNTGEYFEVDADQKFQVKIEVETAYLCVYGT
jgi:hypothetical protein